MIHRTYAKAIAVQEKKYERSGCVEIIVLMGNMKNTIEAGAEKVQPVRNWTTFAVSNGNY